MVCTLFSTSFFVTEVLFLLDARIRIEYLIKELGITRRVSEIYHFQNPCLLSEKLWAGIFANLNLTNSYSHRQIFI